MKRAHQMTAPLEKVIKIILTSIERGYHAVNLRSSMPKPCGFSTPRTRMPRRAYVDTPSRGVTLGAIIRGLFLICLSDHNYYLRLMNVPIDIGAETSGG